MPDDDRPTPAELLARALGVTPAPEPLGTTEPPSDPADRQDEPAH